MSLARMDGVPLATMDDVETRAKEALINSPIYLLHDLDVVKSDERLFITGKVRTFYQKQLAQEVVRRFADGLEVVNEVTVG